MNNGEKRHFVPYIPEARFAFSQIDKVLGQYQVHPLPITIEELQIAKENTDCLLSQIAENRNGNGAETAALLLIEGVINDEQFVVIFEAQRKVSEGESYQPLVVPEEYNEIYQRQLWTMVGAMERTSGGKKLE